MPPSFRLLTINNFDWHLPQSHKLAWFMAKSEWIFRAAYLALWEQLGFHTKNVVSGCRLDIFIELHFCVAELFTTTSVSSLASNVVRPSKGARPFQPTFSSIQTQGPTHASTAGRGSTKSLTWKSTLTSTRVSLKHSLHLSKTSQMAWKVIVAVKSNWRINASRL